MSWRNDWCSRTRFVRAHLILHVERKPGPAGTQEAIITGSNHYQQYWDSVARAFVHPIQSEALLGGFVSNQNLTGQYAESWVRWLVRSMVRNCEVSTGAIIRSSDRPKKRRGLQCDLIVWDPSELPAPLSVGEFALVPSFSARALIEIRRTTTAPATLRKQLADRRAALSPSYQRYVLGVVVRHPDPLFEHKVDPDWVERRKCDDEPALTRLLSKNGQPDTDGIFALIYLLSHLAGHRGAVS